jgi:hypothetical protein
VFFSTRERDVCISAVFPENEAGEFKTGRGMLHRDRQAQHDRNEQHREHGAEDEQALYHLDVITGGTSLREECGPIITKRVVSESARFEAQLSLDLKRRYLIRYTVQHDESMMFMMYQHHTPATWRLA